MHTDFVPTSINLVNVNRNSMNSKKYPFYETYFYANLLRMKNGKPLEIYIGFLNVVFAFYRPEKAKQ